MSKSNPNLIAKRYAQALFTLAQEQKNMDAVYADLQIISKMIATSTEFKKFLANPTIELLKRRIIIEEIFKNKLHALTYRYLLFLQAKNRLNLLTLICNQFENFYQEVKGVVKVKITTSVALDHAQIISITQKLKSKFKNDIATQLNVDPRMMGGFKAQMNDFIYDYTIQKQIENFRRNVEAAHI